LIFTKRLHFYCTPFILKWHGLFNEFWIRGGQPKLFCGLPLENLLKISELSKLPKQWKTKKTRELKYHKNFHNIQCTSRIRKMLGKRSIWKNISKPIRNLENHCLFKKYSSIKWMFIFCWKFHEPYIWKIIQKNFFLMFPHENFLQLQIEMKYPDINGYEFIQIHKKKLMKIAEQIFKNFWYFKSTNFEILFCQKNIILFVQKSFRNFFAFNMKQKLKFRWIVFNFCLLNLRFEIGGEKCLEVSKMFDFRDGGRNLVSKLS
jgi:hypothetical protein